MKRALELNPASPVVRLRYASDRTAAARSYRRSHRGARRCARVGSSVRGSRGAGWRSCCSSAASTIEGLSKPGWCSKPIRLTTWATSSWGTFAPGRGCSMKRSRPTAGRPSSPVVRRSSWDGSAWRWRKAGTRLRRAPCSSAFIRSRSKRTFRRRASPGSTSGSEKWTVPSMDGPRDRRARSHDDADQDLPIPRSDPPRPALLCTSAQDASRSLRRTPAVSRTHLPLGTCAASWEALS